MKGLKHTDREKEWRIFHKFEERERAHRLRKISINDSFRILKGLYQFVNLLGAQKRLEGLERTKIQLLAKVHSLFGKVTS